MEPKNSGRRWQVVIYNINAQNAGSYGRAVVSAGFTVFPTKKAVK